PRAADVAGFAVFGHEATIDSVTVDGAPTNDVAVGSATAGATERVTISNSTLRGGRRNVLTAIATIGLRIEHDVLAGGAGNGLVLRAGARGLPVLDVDASGNTITGNAGAGVLLDLEPPDGLPVLADGIRLAQNTVTGNARRAPARLRAGIVIRGGQRDGRGVVALEGNAVHGNAGAAVLERDLRERIAATSNTLVGGVAPAGRAPGERAAKRWTPSPAQLAAAGTD